MVGLRINNYEIVSILGRGAMGTVYLARHPFMGRQAAIKIMRRELVEDRALVARFMNESRAANAIRHPNIIDIIDVGTLPDGGQPYLMMELLEGESLGKRIRRDGALPVLEAVAIVAQTASALAATHAQGIVHRDLKPDNLFLVADPHAPAGLRVKVLDFGVAKLRPELRGELSNTNSGAFLGTPRYMSPEQCSGSGPEIDLRTDVYSLGVILYHLLCGVPPFQGEGFGDVLMQHMSQPPPPPRQHRPEIPPPLEAVVLRALAKARGDRFASMGAFEAALRAAVNHLPAAEATLSSRTLAGASATVVLRRSRAGMVGLVLGLAVLSGTAIWSALRGLAGSSGAALVPPPAPAPAPAPPMPTATTPAPPAPPPPPAPTAGKGDPVAGTTGDERRSSRHAGRRRSSPSGGAAGGAGGAPAEGGAGPPTPGKPARNAEKW